jgi:hypothetical protein
VDINCGRRSLIREGKAPAAKEVCASPTVSSPIRNPLWDHACKPDLSRSTVSPSRHIVVPKQLMYMLHTPGYQHMYNLCHFCLYPPYVIHTIYLHRARINVHHEPLPNTASSSLQSQRNAQYRATPPQISVPLPARAGRGSIGNLEKRPNARAGHPLA